MPNGDQMLNDAEFENQIEKIGHDPIELMKFTARQVHAISRICPVHTKEIADLKKQNRKTMSLIGGAGAIIGTAITATIDYLLKRG